MLSDSRAFLANKPHSSPSLSRVAPKNGSSYRGQENGPVLTPEQRAQRSLEVGEKKKNSTYGICGEAGF